MIGTRVVSSEISGGKFPEIYSNLSGNLRKFVNYLCVTYTLCVRAGRHTLWARGTTGLQACWACEGNSLGLDMCELTSVGHSASIGYTRQTSADIAKK